MAGQKHSKPTVAVIFAREDTSGFNRCSFPILGRSVVSYPIMAALVSKKIDKVYLSTQSERILQTVKAFDNICVIHRENECDTLVEEFQRSALKVIEELGEEPAQIVLLLGNSPCILSKTIDNALEILETKLELDSVVTVVKRREFSPVNAFHITDSGLLKPLPFDETESSYEYFVDGRLMAVRTHCLLNIREPYNNFSAIYGDNVFPIFQEEGIADIDYTWQVPVAERWLIKNGFSDKLTPYKKKTQKTSDFLRHSVKRSSVKSQKKYNVFISTVPFGEIDSYPVDILKKESNCEFVINPLGRRLNEDELAEIIKDYDILIAGTEPITAKVMDNAPHLKLISRVGIGLDNVDLLHARELGINVSYTPDAPAPAVAELTIGHILSACRSIPLADRKLRAGIWQRIMGQRLSNQVIGIIGTGRIGSRVLKHLQGFSPKRILVNDIQPDHNLYDLFHAELVSKEVIYRESDIITLHVPLTPQTSPLIAKRELELMKPNMFLINTARGGIINEKDLFDALKNGEIGAAAIDVFDTEPYGGELLTLDNCYLTCHMGSCTTDCRFEMEKLATEEAVRFIREERLRLQVPEYEYELQQILKQKLFV
jgi:D-3-phosphoglycerate dehydrogenase / 2-oxoglutarate reductase